MFHDIWALLFELATNRSGRRRSRHLRIWPRGCFQRLFGRISDGGFGDIKKVISQLIGRWRLGPFANVCSGQTAGELAQGWCWGTRNQRATALIKLNLNLASASRMAAARGVDETVLFQPRRQGLHPSLRQPRLTPTAVSTFCSRQGWTRVSARRSMLQKQRQVGGGAGGGRPGSVGSMGNFKGRPLITRRLQGCSRGPAGARGQRRRQRDAGRNQTGAGVEEVTYFIDLRAYGGTPSPMPAAS
jgi:hypothetical protein